MTALEVPSNSRRLKVYGLSDVSGSMSGPPLEALKNGLNELVQALRTDVFASETTWLSLTTFADTAQVVLPLTAVADARIPELVAGGQTRLDLALKSLGEQLKKDHRPSNPELGHRGDFKSVLWLLTDGHFNNGWKPAMDEFLAAHRRQFSRVIAIGLGNADVAALKHLTEETYAADGVTPALIKQACEFLSQSITSVAKAVSVPTAAAAPQTPAPPVGMIAA